MTDEQILAILRIARDRIALPGDWRQGSIGAYANDHGGVCAWGAIYYGYFATTAGQPLADHDHATDDLIVAANELVRDLADYNDTPGRTQAEMLTMFDIAIARVRARLEPAAPVEQRELVNA